MLEPPPRPASLAARPSPRSPGWRYPRRLPGAVPRSCCRFLETCKYSSDLNSIFFHLCSLCNVRTTCCVLLQQRRCVTIQQDNRFSPRLLGQGVQGCQRGPSSSPGRPARAVSGAPRCLALDLGRDCQSQPPDLTLATLAAAVVLPCAFRLQQSLGLLPFGVLPCTWMSGVGNLECPRVLPPQNPRDCPAPGRTGGAAVQMWMT